MQGVNTACMPHRRYVCVCAVLHSSWGMFMQTLVHKHVYVFNIESKAV